ncbi:MAG: hypothetical protein JWO85_3017, partial [Candidatus Eremiobacteraeota bacterium]|nr:hypothetical protein [Candidatus Eremiobacteraeota bacterium]
MRSDFNETRIGTHGVRPQRPLDGAHPRVAAMCERMTAAGVREKHNLSTDILVSSDPWENRVAILEDGRLAEIYVEREERVIGSIYKG